MIELMLGIQIVDQEEFQSIFGQVLDNLNVPEEQIPDELFAEISSELFGELLEIQKQ